MTKTDLLVEIPKTKTMKPRSDTEDNDKIKKITTKMMIVNALKELKSRKGTSLYAIKKYLEEEYQVNPDKSKYLIKKSIKTGIEDGTIIQVKGIGATGSFKLGKEEKVKKPKMKKLEKESKPKSKKDDESKPKMKKVKKSEKPSKPEKEKTKPKKESAAGKKEKMSKKSESTKKVSKEKPEKKSKEDSSKQEKKKAVKIVQTPAKKKSAIMKRKSIGSIIKPPKMKPKKI